MIQVFLADWWDNDRMKTQFQHFLSVLKVNKIKPAIWARPESPEHIQQLWFSVIGLTAYIVVMKSCISQEHRATHSTNVMKIYCVCVCMWMGEGGCHVGYVPISIIEIFIWMQLNIHNGGENSMGTGLTGACVQFDKLMSSSYNTKIHFYCIVS